MPPIAKKCFHRFLILLLSLLYFSFAMAQENTTEKNEKVSYFKASTNYTTNSVFNGRADSLATPYITPSFGYVNKSGLSVIGSLSYLSSAADSHIDLFSIDLGYEFELMDNFSGSITANKSFYNGASTAIKSDLNASLGASFDYDFDFIQLSVGTDAIFSSKTDIGLNYGLSHAFTFEAANGAFKITPTFMANMSTLHFYEGFTSRKIGKKARVTIANLLSSSSVTTVNKNKLTLLDYELSLPFSYEVNKMEFFFTPTLAMPQNPIYTTTTTTNILKNNTQDVKTKNSTPDSEINLKNRFFAELGVSIKF